MARPGRILLTGGAGFIGSVLGAIVLLFIVGKLKGPGASEGS